MSRLTVAQYEDALKHSRLTEKQVKTLKVLYHFRDATATATELAKVISPNSGHIVVINGIMGRIGKTFSQYLGVQPSGWYGHKKPAYFELVGPWTDRGWAMHVNLQQALLNLKYVTPLREAI